jgi:hypothetical protein
MERARAVRSAKKAKPAAILAFPRATCVTKEAVVLATGEDRTTDHHLVANPLSRNLFVLTIPCGAPTCL